MSDQTKTSCLATRCLELWSFIWRGDHAAEAVEKACGEGAPGLPEQIFVFRQILQIPREIS